MKKINIIAGLSVDTVCRFRMQRPTLGNAAPGRVEKCRPPTTTTTSYSFFSPKVTPPPEMCRPGALPSRPPLCRGPVPV